MVGGGILENVYAKMPTAAARAIPARIAKADRLVPIMPQTQPA